MIIIEERIDLFRIQIRQSLAENDCVYRSRINTVTFEAKKYVEKRISINNINRIDFPIVMHIATKCRDFLHEIEEENELTNRELERLIDILA